MDKLASCTSCGAAVSEGASFCESCGQPVAPPAPGAPDADPGAPGEVDSSAPAEPRPARRKGSKQRPTGAGQAAPTAAGRAAEPPLQWQCRVPVLTNRFIVGDMLKVFGLSLLALELLGALTTFIIDGEAFFLPLQALLIPIGVLIVLFVLTTGVVLGNRFDMRFTLNSKWATVDSRPSPSSNRILRIAAFLPLFLSGKWLPLYGAATSDHGETSGIVWSDVERIREYPRQRVIALSDSWHTLLRLYCPPDVYDQALAFVHAHAAPGLRRREKRIAARARPPRGFWAVWLLLVLAGTFATGGWYWAADLRDRFALLAGVLVLLSGLLPEAWAWLTGAAGALCSLIVLGSLLVPAFERGTDAWGNPDYGFQMDTGWLLLSIAGALLLLAMALFRMRGYGPGGVRSQRAAQPKKARGD